MRPSPCVLAGVLATLLNVLPNAAALDGEPVAIEPAGESLEGGAMAPPPAGIPAGLRERVAERLGGKAGDYQLRRLPELNLYEAYSTANARIAYVDAAVDYVFLGSLLKTDDQTNLTEAREHELNRLPLDSLPLDRAIRIVKGKGTLRFAVFEDPDCPYCRAMEKRLEEFDDYTLYVLLLPITELHPRAAAAAQAIWCADDPSAAWHAYVIDKVLPPARACTTPIAELHALAEAHRVHGTPTLLMPDGEIVEGMPTLATLKAKIERGARKS